MCSFSTLIVIGLKENVGTPTLHICSESNEEKREVKKGEYEVKSLKLLGNKEFITLWRGRKFARNANETAERS